MTRSTDDRITAAQLARAQLRYDAGLPPQYPLPLIVDKLSTCGLFNRTEPPAVLYHGTTEARGEAIEREGLRGSVPGSPTPSAIGPLVNFCGALVFLSDVRSISECMARDRSRRARGVTFAIDADRAHLDGIAFYPSPNDMWRGTWIAENVPAKYLRRLAP